MRAGERAYQALRADIVEWRLLPGQVLGEVELSERLGISRTPVREALSRLTADGLTEPHSGRGVVVATISADDVRSLYEFRDSLDCRAAELAARRGDRKFSAPWPRNFSRPWKASPMTTTRITSRTTNWSSAWMPRSTRPPRIRSCDRHRPGFGCIWPACASSPSPTRGGWHQRPSNTSALPRPSPTAIPPWPSRPPACT